MDFKKVDIPTVITAVVVVFVLMSLSSIIISYNTPSLPPSPRPCRMRLLQQQFEDDGLLSSNNSIEKFGNEEEFVKRNPGDDEYTTFTNFNVKSKTTYKYNNINLTPTSTKDNYPSNLLTGRAERYLLGKDSTEIFYLEVYCHLYVLGGDPFDKSDLKTIKQNYSVYLIDDNKNKIYVGDLTKDGDGIYKLKVNNTAETLKKYSVNDLMKHSKLEVTYKIHNEKTIFNDKETILLMGEF